MHPPFTNPFRGYLSWLHGLALSVLWLMGGCRSPKKGPDPEPAVFFPGGYIGTLTVSRPAGSSLPIQTYDSLTVLIVKQPHPDSVLVSLVHRNRFFPNPLLATVGPRLLTVFSQHPFAESRTLTGQATRTGDSLHLMLNESGGSNPVTYQIRTTRLLN